jgi:hypothetical protein
MADRQRTVYQEKNGIYNRREHGEVTLTQGDTVTFLGFDAASTIWLAKFFQKSNGVEVTCTTALNVATITGAVAAAPCIYIAYGIKA